MANPGRAGGLLRILFVLVAVGLGGYLLLKFYGNGSEGRNYTNIPKEYHLTYKPADFQGQIDDENALAILTNPNRYQREFNSLVYDFNMSLLNHVANRMGLSDVDKRSMQKEYEKHHEYIKGMYYNDFITLKDTTSTAYKSWYGTEMGDAVEYMNEVASKYTCFLVNLVLGTVLETQGGAIAAKGNRVETPCGIALTEGLRPMIKRLQEKAAIDDFTRSKGLIQQRVERAIAELATMEVEDTKALTRSLQTKVLGYAVSTTDIEISAMSHLKVGFDLQKAFGVDVNSKSGEVVITLPQPEILSLEVYPRVDKMDIGWMREVQSNDLNKDMEALTEAFRQDAINSDVFSKAREQAADLMDTMMGPVVASLGNKYKLRVRFKGNASTEYSNNTTRTEPIVSYE
ncbi:MAG: DUF4230 domain-containing protein [Bacteroidota bacterium]